MAVGLKIPEIIYAVEGVRLSAISANIKKDGSHDLVLLELAEGSSSVALFTRNAFCAAPVTVARSHMEKIQPRALLINSGNANAGTGTQGLENAEKCCAALADRLSIRAEEVLPFSTGVISEQLPMPQLLKGLDFIKDKLAAENWLIAARGIATTDTVPKIISVKSEIAGNEITVTGIAKGAGMIRPDMATMLAFIATDAHVPVSDLQYCLEQSVKKSFNAISIDGDTSTNDACVLSATARAKGQIYTRKHPAWEQFQSLIDSVCIELAQSIVRDGEGATKFITLRIVQGRHEQECREVAYTLAHSPLVKTAFFASDPNIGRLLAAVGRSRVQDLDIRTVSISLDEIDIVIDGEPAPSYTEEKGQRVMNRDEITVQVKLGRGEAQCTVWTSDLSYDYVRINAEYRT